MEKNRIDKRIKEVLEGRRIAPSEEGWNRIEQQLEGTVYSSNRSFWRLGVAAGFAGILMISVFWFSRDAGAELPEENAVVTEIPTEEGAREADREPIPPQSQNQVVFSGSDTGEERDRVAEHPDLVIASTEQARDPEVFAVNVEEKLIPPEKLELKVSEVVSQVTILENSGNQVEDAVIDSLLRVAQAQLLKERVLTSSGKIDAMALLSEVEDDLNQSFRDQLFEKLKESYLKVRTAVAYRNE